MAKTRKKPIKKTRRPVRAKAAEAGELDAQTSVRVRMYRQGFGECFLLTFPRLGQRFHMLINCGVLMGTPNAEPIMRDVVKDIAAVTGGRLDVLVVTHPAWDNVSGFFQARKLFDRIKVDQLWLGWPQDPTDSRARFLRRRQRSLLGGPGKPRSRTDEALDYLRGKAKRVRYWRGGEGPIALSGVAGVRIFVLGPPSLDANLQAVLSDNTSTCEIEPSPFDQRDQIGFDAAKEDSRFVAYFGRAAVAGHAADASEEDEQWRRIDSEREHLPSRVNLDWERYRNDMSLVLAIELIGVRQESKVLLFPGDAQLQSWLSWHEHRWPAAATELNPKAMTCRELLGRTVLYKVSHHGSDYGTPRQYGLEMMNSPELVALLPVDEKMARVKRWNLIPHPAVLAALFQRTSGRIIRSDRGLVPPGPKVRNETRWKEFRKGVQISDLSIDYQVEIPQFSAAERRKSVENWTTANERRVYLVDKKLTGTIKPAEAAELRELEKLMDEYLSTTAPTGFGLLAELRQDVEEAKTRQPKG
jgi:beta-lactamase superfamily II metal-dependent hydrolase